MCKRRFDLRYAERVVVAETVLVTGGTGFIARWCIVELLQRGYQVRTTVRSRSREQAVRDAVSRVVDPADPLTCAVADLTSDDGWDAAVAGCDYVLHVASPLGYDGSGDLITPARDGTLRVLRAATAAGVKRVVMTSAANTASPSSYRDEGVSDETLWTDPDTPGLPAYRISKTLAEQSAWQFMETSSGATTLTTILPGAVFGPILEPDSVGSVQVIGRLLNGTMRGTPRIGLEVVDVRDIADVHIRAMTEPQAAGERFLATGEFMWRGRTEGADPHHPRFHRARSRPLRCPITLHHTGIGPQEQAHHGQGRAAPRLAAAARR
jgi:nucleoside-diphosphate-sugar epimerase